MEQSENKIIELVWSNLGLPEEDGLQQLKDLFSLVERKKGSVFAKKDDYPRNIAIIHSGVLRAYYSSFDKEEYNKTFFTEGDFVGAYSALVTNNKNQIDIDCLTDCLLLEANYSQITKLYDKYRSVERMSRVLAEQFFVVKEKREIELVTLEAKERYEIFKNEHPNLEQLIPQYHIASYLGVSPTQLSRIRAKR